MNRLSLVLALLPLALLLAANAAGVASATADASAGRCEADEATVKRQPPARRPEPGVLLMQTKRPLVGKSHGPAASLARLAQRHEQQKQEPDAVLELQALREDVQSLKSYLLNVTLLLQSQAGNCCCGGGEGTDPGTNVSDHTYTTTDTTTTTLPRPNLCSAFGDPHFITFDGAQTTFVGDMVLWLVRSKSVWIQGLSKQSEGKFLGMAVGGPFMQGHTLVIYNSTEYKDSLEVLLDGEPILNETVSEYHLPGVLDGYRVESWDPSKFDSEILNLRTATHFNIGDFPVRFEAPKSGLYLFKLPNNIDVTISGVDYLSAVIAMVRDSEGQSGYCGNFNSDPDDDAEPVVPSWDRPIGEDLDAVPEALNLFRSGEVLALLGLENNFGHGKGQGRKRGTEEDIAKVLEECQGDLMKQAEARCADVQVKAYQRSCIFDICMTGQLDASDDIFTAEIMQEHINARGVPRFIGHGECLDTEGRRFRSFTTNLRTDRACKDLLRQLATTKGVLGAQLQRGHSCQVLAAEDVDPTVVMIPGGWASQAADAVANELGLGQGLVSQSTDDASWNCWQLN